MFELLALLAFVVLFGLTTAYALRLARTRRVTHERLQLGAPEATLDEAPPAPDTRRFVRRRWLAPWLVGVGVALGLHFALGVAWVFAVALGVVVGLLGHQLDAWRVARLADRIEAQLADAIDLMVSSLKVGATLQTGLETALRESHAPLRPQLEEMIGRIRLGDVPSTVLANLAARVPLETFLLFSTTLAVHLEVGGSLVQTLASVGRTIRNRIEITRRLRTLTMQSRASMVAVLLTTYFIGLLMWRADPPRMAGLLASSMGQAITAAAIVLQGVGIVWISALSKPRF